MSEHATRVTVTLLGAWPEIWRNTLIKGLARLMPSEVRETLASAEVVTLYSSLLGQGLVELNFVTPCPWNTMIKIIVQEQRGQTLMVMAMVPWAEDEPVMSDLGLLEGEVDVGCLDDDVIATVVIPPDGWGFTGALAAPWN